MWAILALGAAILTSFNPILYKRMLRDAEAIVVVWGVVLLAVPLLGLFALGPSWRAPGVDWVFVAGVLGSAGLNAVAHLSSARALKLADASLVTPLLIFSPVFTVFIAAVFLGEMPSGRGLMGVGLVLAGAYGLQRGADVKGWWEPVRSLALTPGVALVVLAGLLWSITPLAEKLAIQHTRPESPRFAAFVATALLTMLLTPAVAMRGRSAIAGLAPRWRDLSLAGLIAGVAPVLGYTAFSLGYVGYVTTLFRLSTLLTVVWGFVFLGERGMAHRLPASAIMVVGAILITA